MGLFPSGLTALSQGSVPETPEVTTDASISYVAGSAAVALDPGLSISDPGSPTLAGATISVDAGFLAGDTLSVGSAQAGVTSSYNAGTGVLTLSGVATLAAYQAALELGHLCFGDRVKSKQPHDLLVGHRRRQSVRSGDQQRRSLRQ